MKKQIWAYFLIFTMCVTLLGGCKAPEQEESAIADSVVESTPSAGQTENSAPAQNQVGGSDKLEHTAGDSKTEQPQDSDQKDPVREPDQSDQSENETVAEESKEDASSDADKEEKSDETTTVVTPSPEEPLKNIYEKGALNTAVDINGKNVKSTGSGVSKAIDVKGGDTITFGPASAAQVVQGYLYDAAGKPLQLINANVLKEEATFTGGMKLYTYSVPANGGSIKMNVPNDIRSVYVVARNHPFGLKEYQQLSGKAETAIGEVLKEKSALFLGDSISAAAHDSAKLAWAGRIAKNTGLIATNNSVGGASVSTARPHTIMDQLMRTTNKDFDYVLLHGGVNDAWENAKVGSISEEYDPLFFDEDTYAGGLETLFYNAILFYGDQAAIGYLINFKAPACQHGTIRDMSAYNAVAKKICEKWGVTYLDMYDHEEITAKMEFTTTKNTRDYIHPNDGGYEVITPYIEKYMRTMTPCGEAILKRVFEG